MSPLKVKVECVCGQISDLDLLETICLLTDAAMRGGVVIGGFYCQSCVAEIKKLINGGECESI
jgi:hypothetical protein